MKRKHHNEKMSEAGRWILSDAGREIISKLKRNRRRKRVLAKKNKGV